MTLAIKNLTHQYNAQERPLYENVNMTFEPRTLYSIVGQSGSGKTTLLSFLAGLDTPSEGTITLDDQDIKSYGLTKYRNQKVAIIFQAYNLLNYMTAAQNVASALSMTKSKHTGDKDYIYSTLNKLGIDSSLADKNVQQLSGGQQQRVAIARALAVDAKIVIADEPTGNLDEENTQEVISIFQELAHEVGKTVIIVTHEPNVAKAADIQISLKNRQFTVV
ncbi:ABC transporter ATP-binding protein [Leuconostoc falkenbergense]|jgi:putative ABC transport system ATP-binding protein|uniref:ABC transporter n=2 Tax=Leuconostoc TaxID=1243 RepID=A0A1X0VEZ8_LEUPS|nr:MULTISPECIES: ABC transporter ATP-binding protein [Leuconostoc]MCT4378808.1 ABC transporter ATP-binding protein [Leuconostoc falkenbergense]MCT4411151.1 ABC transporter ATP-binding protein [Leuconostoc falkenbergense]MDM7645463.1 ABC transporter ATP-binding protein [Leuconostoc falkenbergense]MDV8950822.1 ATP-binding cassette domain-containing protein [Leuconostoc falkenbergense]NLT85723.1 ABC transporter ATP-binding protein [Leuconostoc sp.]